MKKQSTGVSLIITTEPFFVEGKAFPNVSAVEILNVYGTATELIRDMLLKIGVDRDVVLQSMSTVHAQAITATTSDSREAAAKVLAFHEKS